MVLSMDRWVGKVAVVTGASSGIGAAIAEALVDQGLVDQNNATSYIKMQRGSSGIGAAIAKALVHQGLVDQNNVTSYIKMQWGSSGIGAAIAEALVHQGLVVAGLARRKDRLDELAQKLNNKKGKFYAVQTDITKEEDIVNAFKWIKDNLGPVHVLINNAGVYKPTDLVDGDTEIWKNIINVNVLGLSIATREAVRDMKANNVDGHIIHINSVAGHQVLNFPKANMYPASKFAVRALAETLRLEFLNLKSKIKITNLSPGLTDTEIVPAFIKEKIEESGGKPMIESENIADGVVYALSTPPHVQIQELTISGVEELSFE